MIRSSRALSHKTVIGQPRIVGGFGVACRCGYGSWFETRAQAEADRLAHERAAQSRGERLAVR